LPVIKADADSYTIKNARQLHNIKYSVDDSWDSPEIKGQFIVEPAGTNFEDKQIFMLNNHCLFGYFDNMKSNHYQINFIHPLGFYGSTSMERKYSKINLDTYFTKNYYDLVDAPIMYCKPDTTTIRIGEAKILVSLYSPNKKCSSFDIAVKLKKILEAQKAYLGGKLPIKKIRFYYLFG
jgi:predicted metalloprotease with PDZ domain